MGMKGISILNTKNHVFSSKSLSDQQNLKFSQKGFMYKQQKRKEMF